MAQNPDFHTPFARSPSDNVFQDQKIVGEALHEVAGQKLGVVELDEVGDVFVQHQRGGEIHLAADVVDKAVKALGRPVFFGGVDPAFGDLFLPDQPDPDLDHNITYSNIFLTSSV